MLTINIAEMEDLIVLMELYFPSKKTHSKGIPKVNLQMDEIDQFSH